MNLFSLYLSSESFENESSWPLLIINHCMSTYDDEGKVRTFVADIKRIVKEKKEAEKKKVSQNHRLYSQRNLGPQGIWISGFKKKELDLKNFQGLQALI